MRERFGQLDLLVYSMAAPTRTDPDTGQTWRSAIKPLGEPVRVKTLNTETGEVLEASLAPASEEEAAATVAVMGGDDWKRWIDQLRDADVLAPGFQTLNYTYIGSELTWPIYWKGTLGRAKADIDQKAEAIRGQLGEDAARIVALKAVVTQASSAIPVVPLYGTVLFKVMKSMGLHEGCIEQIDRLFRTRLGPDAALDDEGRLRLDGLGAVGPRAGGGVVAALASADHPDPGGACRFAGIPHPVPAPVRVRRRRRGLRAGLRPEGCAGMTDNLAPTVRLFSYGTLRQRDVQLATFGRGAGWAGRCADGVCRCPC